VTGRWFSPGTQVSSTNKTDRHDIAKILLKVALNTITITLKESISLKKHNIQENIKKKNKEYDGKNKLW
jgi:hypothetical protein